MLLGRPLLLPSGDGCKLPSLYTLLIPGGPSFSLLHLSHLVPLFLWNISTWVGWIVFGLLVLLRSVLVAIVARLLVIKLLLEGTKLSLDLIKLLVVALNGLSDRIDVPARTIIHQLDAGQLF